MKYIMAIPETTLKLYEVEVDVEGNYSKEQALQDFKEGNSDHLTETYIGTCRVGAYRDKATLLAEVPEKK